MRKFVRHPSSIPIELSIDRERCCGPMHMHNLSSAGIACRVEQALPVGSTVQVRIPLIWPDYRGCGVVVWCRQHGDGYEAGIRFAEADALKTKMVEQLCQIEQYRQQLAVERGEDIDDEEAAREWIRRHAREFSATFDGRKEGRAR